MTSRSKKYGIYAGCSMCCFTPLFTFLFAGLAGAFSETGADFLVIAGAIFQGMAIAFIVTIAGLCYFACQEES